MKMNKLNVALAALALGASIGAAVTAAPANVLTYSDLDQVEIYVENGQVQELLAFLQLHLELLEIKGALGGALKAFVAHPTSASLARVADRAGDDISVALAGAAERSNVSIY